MSILLAALLTSLAVASCSWFLLLWLVNKKPLVTTSSVPTQTCGDLRADIAKSTSLVAHHDSNLTQKLAPGTPLNQNQQDALPPGLKKKLTGLFKDGKGKSFIAEAPSPLQQYQPSNESAIRVNQYFNILVINLDIHQPRLKRMAESFERQELNWRRIRAVYGKDELINRNEAQDKGLIHVHIDPITRCKWRSDGKSMYSTGAMGCAASHIKALHIAAASSKPTVIFEDDMLLRGCALREQLANLIDYIDDYPCDYLFLGAFKCISRSQPEEIIALQDIFQADAKNNCANANMAGKGACAYLVTPEGAKKILAFYAKKANPLRPADHYIRAQDDKGKEIDVRMVHPLWFTTVHAESSDLQKHANIGKGTFGL
jgi:GR25 family glycosyltransferase involved in LPS biosynthesis